MRSEVSYLPKEDYWDHRRGRLTGSDQKQSKVANILPSSFSSVEFALSSYHPLRCPCIHQPLEHSFRVEICVSTELRTGAFLSFLDDWDYQ